MRTLPDKVRENRLRRMAQRQGLVLRKSQRRDPRAQEFGLFHIVDPRRNVIAAGDTPLNYSMTLDDVEHCLRAGKVRS